MPREPGTQGLQGRRCGILQRARAKGPAGWLVAEVSPSPAQSGEAIQQKTALQRPAA